MSLRQQVEYILSPAIDAKAPYVKLMIDAIVNLLQEKHVGIIADNMAEVVERSKETMEKHVVDLRTADSVEVIMSDPYIVQINVDGVMLVHIQNVTSLVMPTTNRRTV